MLTAIANLAELYLILHLHPTLWKVSHTFLVFKRGARSRLISSKRTDRPALPDDCTATLSSYIFCSILRFLPLLFHLLPSKQ